MCSTNSTYRVSILINHRLKMFFFNKICWRYRRILSPSALAVLLPSPSSTLSSLLALSSPPCWDSMDAIRGALRCGEHLPSVRGDTPLPLSYSRERDGRSLLLQTGMACRGVSDRRKSRGQEQPGLRSRFHRDLYAYIYT